MQQYSEADQGNIIALSWRFNVVVSGDTNGVLAVWDFETRRSKIVHTGKAVRNILHSPSRNFNHVLVLDKFGEITTWDMDKYSRLYSTSFVPPLLFFLPSFHHFIFPLPSHLLLLSSSSYYAIYSTSPSIPSPPFPSFSPSLLPLPFTPSSPSFPPFLPSPSFPPLPHTFYFH